MKIIQSSSNELIKRYSKLSQKKYRDKEKLFIIEGKKNVYDTLKLLSPSEIEAILLAPSETDALLAVHPYLEPKLLVVDKNILDKISDYSSQSEIITIAKQRDFSKNIESDLCLYLDRIRDPANLGTIIRTAAALGYGILLDNCCDIYNPKVVRGSMSAISVAKLMEANADTITDYKKQGYKLIGADMKGKDIFSFKSHSINTPLIIAIGNEAEGLSKSILSHCDHLVALPMEQIESLNAALAAGVLMFEYKYRVSNSVHC